jgi:hypothetical protein
MRMLSIIALSFAFVSVASAGNGEFKVKLGDGKIEATEGTVDGKPATADQLKQFNGFLGFAQKARAEAKEKNPETLGMFSSLLAGFGL